MWGISVQKQHLLREHSLHRDVPSHGYKQKLSTPTAPKGTLISSRLASTGKSIDFHLGSYYIRSTAGVQGFEEDAPDGRIELQATYVGQLEAIE